MTTLAKVIVGMFVAGIAWAATLIVVGVLSRQSSEAAQAAEHKKVLCTLLCEHHWHSPPPCDCPPGSPALEPCP